MKLTYEYRRHRVTHDVYVVAYRRMTPIGVSLILAGMPPELPELDRDPASIRLVLSSNFERCDAP